MFHVGLVATVPRIIDRGRRRSPFLVVVSRVALIGHRLALQPLDAFARAHRAVAGGPVYWRSPHALREQAIGRSGLRIADGACYQRADQQPDWRSLHACLLSIRPALWAMAPQ